MTRGAALLTVALAAACRHTTKPEPAGGAPGRAPKAEQAGGVPPRAGRPAVPATPDALIGPEDIAEVQRALAGRGLLRGHREGRLDDPTTAALQEFQRQEGLAATGFPDRATVRRLGVDPEQAYRRGRRQPEDGAGAGAGSGAGSTPDSDDRRR